MRWSFPRLLFPAAMSRLAIALVLVGALSLLGHGASVASALTFYVDTTADHDDGYCGFLLPISVDCTLREAINGANNNAGHDEIRFLPSVPVNGVFLSTGDFPVIDAADGITIDGSGRDPIIENGSPLIIGSAAGVPAHDIVLTDLIVRSSANTGLWICAGRDAGVCLEDLTTVTISTVTSRFNGAEGISIGGWNLTGIALSNVQAHDNSDIGVAIGAYGDISTISMTGGELYKNGSYGIIVSASGQVSGVSLAYGNVHENIGTGIRINSAGEMSNVNIIQMHSYINGYTSPVGHGIHVESNSTLNGLLVDGAGILVAGGVQGNAGNGLLVHTSGTAQNIDITGLTAHANKQNGIRLGTTGGSMFDVNVTGGLVDGNTQDGLLIDASAALTQVTVSGGGQYNTNGDDGLSLHGGLAVGTINVSGNTMNENAELGIGVQSTSGAVGGVTVEDNTVAGNTGGGIFFEGDAAGLGNNFIRRNTISNNGDAGVYVSGTPTRAVISRNEIYGSAKLGIDLYSASDPPNGVTPNDLGDGDSGPNGLLNFPVIETASTQTVTGTACAGCLVEVFAAATDPSGYGEGFFFIGEGVADQQGHFSASVCGAGWDAGITATATDLAVGATSEFSFNVNLPGFLVACAATPTPSPTPTPTASPTATATPTTTASASASATPSPTGTAPSQLVQGDVNCTGSVNMQDFDLLIRFAAEVNDGVTPGLCPDIGGAVPAGGNPSKWGDVNCSGQVDALDSLMVLAWPDFELPHPGCEDIGAILS